MHLNYTPDNYFFLLTCVIMILKKKLSICITPEEMSKCYINDEGQVFNCPVEKLQVN